MSIIRSNIARQLLAEGGAPRKGFARGSTGFEGSPEMGGSRSDSPSRDDGFGGGDDVQRDTYAQQLENIQRLEGSDTVDTFPNIDKVTARDLFKASATNPLLYRSPGERAALAAFPLVGPLIAAGEQFAYDLPMFQYSRTGGNKDRFNEDDDDSNPITLPKLRAPIEEKEEPKNKFNELLKFYGARFARGGSTGFEGSPEMGGRGTEETYGFDQSGPAGDSGDDGGPPTVMGGETAPLGVPTFQNLQRHFDNNAKLAEAVRMGLITNEEYNVLGGYDVNQTMGLNPALTGLGSLAYNVVQSVKGDQPFSEIAGDVGRNVGGAMGLSPGLQSKYESIVGPGSAMMTSLQPFGGPRRFEDGGEVREGYKLGDIVGGIGKVFGKATDAAKKVFKSPIGRAALFATPFLFPSVRTAGIGAARAGKNKFLDFILGKQFVDTGDEVFRSGGINPLTAILGLSALSGLTAKQTEEEDENDVQTVKSDPAFQKLLAYYGGPRRFAQGGDVEDEMLDLGGKEMDLRGGGFVPLGEYEKKDDVPARLSKNEFVFTADAVRAAGGGSVDKGADVMYKTMKTLENKVA